MAAGQLVAEGSPNAIKSRQTGHLLEFVVDQPQQALDVLKTELERWRVSLFGTRLHVITDDDVEAAKRVIAGRLEGHRIHVIAAREAQLSLEDVFIKVVETTRERTRVAGDV
jgi:drug efflux transport system ATP-binding protein